MTALGLVFSVLSDGAIPLETGIALGAAIVLGYTIWGGMWSVALTDLFQTVVILIGLTAVAFLVGGMAGGPHKVIAAAYEAGKFEFWPKSGAKEWLAFLAAWMTLAIGSIPQQDVFQRVTSAKDERTAVRGSLFGGLAYFCFAFVPVFIAYSALMIDPSAVEERVAHHITINGDDDGDLLVRWLNELVYLVDARGLVFHRFVVERRPRALAARDTKKSAPVRCHRGSRLT